MAQSTLTYSEKTILITIVAAMFLVGGWAGLGAILGFAGTVTLTTTVSTILASIAGLMASLIVVMVVMIRKA